MTDEIKFDHKGNVPVPEKEDPVTAKMTSEINKKIQKEGIESQVRQDTGTEKTATKTGTMTKDVPQVVFKIAAGMIPCKRFELTEEEAQLMATNLNILIPVEGKIMALLVIILITLNKVYACLDVLKSKMGTASVEAEKPKEKLPDLIT